jgi:1-deoxy-D-xylulose-5-phosphate reductoisomerase
MKLPIQYAIGYPQRLKNNFPRFNFFDYPTLSFEQPDRETFSNLTLAFSALQKGGNIACALNAANEISVDAFLKGKIKFLDIAEINGSSIEKVTFVARPNYEDYVATDEQTRIIAKELVG